MGSEADRVLIQVRDGALGPQVGGEELRSGIHFGGGPTEFAPGLDVGDEKRRGTKDNSKVFG